MLIKTCSVVELKAAPDDEPGVFEAIVSIFGNKDSYGDVVVRGAFTDTLQAWASKGRPIPILYSHRTDDPRYNIGRVLDAKETNVGLWAKGQLRLSNPVAQDVYDQFKDGTLTQFSFAYAVKDAAMVRTDELGDFYELRKLDLFEVGPTPMPANQETALLDVKYFADHLAKAGRVLSSKNETALRAAYEQIGTVLAGLDTTDDSPKSTGHDGVKTEEPTNRVPAEPAAVDPMVLVQTLELDLDLSSV